MRVWFGALISVFLYFSTGAQASDIDRAVAAVERGDCKTGVRILEDLAAPGNKIAQYYLGVLFQTGKCKPKNARTAFRWYAKSAEQGFAEAQGKIGWMYANGIGVKRDLRKGAIWSHASAAQGNKVSKSNLAAICHELGWAYMGGQHGYSQDMVLAFVWFSLSERNGHPEGAFHAETMKETIRFDGGLQEGKKILKKCVSSSYRNCE